MGDKQSIVDWLNSYDGTFDELQAAVLRAAQAAGRVGDAAVQTGEASPTTASALSDAQSAARDLLAVTSGVRKLPAIPDVQTQTAFDAGLGRWIDAAETMVAAASDRNVPELERAARALEAGTDEFLRAAAALRRATGQAPDPNNPKS